MRRLLLIFLAVIIFEAPILAQSETKVVNEQNVIEEIEGRINKVKEKILPLVVHIDVIQKYMGTRKRKASGSGIIVSKDGYILTNNHVVAQSTKIDVTLMGDERKYSAKLIGRDELTDIAVIQIKVDKNFDKPAFQPYKDVKVGEYVLAFGNPYGLDGSITQGIVSAKGRNINYGKLINEFIQTDAMIDYGSSGGPLVNFKGELVGINSMGEGRGIGFTIPIDTALKVMDSFINNKGKINRGWLGVFVQSFNRDLADYYGVPDLTGVIITGFIDGSPAKKAGIKAGDIVTEIDGKVIEAEEAKDLNSFRRIISSHKPKDKVKIKVYRVRKNKKGKYHTYTVKLTSHPNIDPDKQDTDFGFGVADLTLDNQLSLSLQDKKGVIVTYIENGSAASEAGLSVHNVIIKIDNYNINNITDFKKAINKVKNKKKFLIVCRGKYSKKFVVIKKIEENGKKNK